MYDVSVVGIGNAGSQVATLAKELLAVDAIAINSSETDLDTVPNSIKKKLIGDGRGSGKNREKSLDFLEKDIAKVMSDEEMSALLAKDIVFIVSSTGGGTGSGAALVMTSIMQQLYPDTRVIVIGILPALKEGYSTQVNTTLYLDDLYHKLNHVTYMLYDNEKSSKLSTPRMMQTVNECIVKDIDVIRGTYQIPTRYSSIDERDMNSIIATDGRIVIASLRDLKEKDLDDTTFDDLLIDEFKSNAHCELQRDKIVVRTGIISNLSDRMTDMFDSHIDKVQEFIGSPVEEFEHIAVNPDKHLPNHVFLVASGLTAINDRIRRINDRIEEIRDSRNLKEEESELSRLDMKDLTSEIHDARNNEPAGDPIDVRDIFSMFKK